MKFRIRAFTCNKTGIRLDLFLFGSLRLPIKFHDFKASFSPRRDFFVPPMRRSIKSRRYLSAFDACDFFVNTPDQKPMRKIHDYCVLRHYPTRTGRCAGRRQRKARKAGVGARAAFACWWREGTVRRARCALRKCKWMYITRQDRADEANLGPGVHRTRERDG